MSERVANVVVTCTKRKAVPAEESLQLGRIAGATVSELAKVWISRLKAERSTTRPAEELYSGDHWQIARSLPEIASGQRVKVRLWVCSAGYGLIPSWAPLKPYSATFSTHHKDSVLRMLTSIGGSSLYEWWSRIARWSGPVPGEPRTLSDLARGARRSPLIFVASDIYLRAVGKDLEDARNSLADPGLLTIVSGGGQPCERLRSNLLPCDARLQSLVGGALMSLNVRIVRRILSSGVRWPLRCKDLASEYQELLDAQTDFEQPRRLQQSDDKIQHFIRRQLARDPSSCASPLLRQFRDSGFACEQKRFGKLFLQVREQFHE